MSQSTFQWLVDLSKRVDIAQALIFERESQGVVNRWKTSLNADKRAVLERAIKNQIAAGDFEDIASPASRLKRIALIVEHVEQRAMACDGPVTPTLKEMSQNELSRIYALAKGYAENWKP